jgi:predicted metal-dependent peptidase
MDEKARDKLMQARVNLILREPFFGALSLRLRLVEAAAETAFTDGTVIGYNPAYINEQSVKRAEGLLAHEVLHIACGHIWRADHPRYKLTLTLPDGTTRQVLDPKCNIAMDYAINPILLDAGFQLPEGALYDKKFRGKSWEEIYDLLPPTKVQTITIGLSGVEGAGDGNGCGAVRPAPGEDAEKAEQENNWAVAVAQAAQVARQQGDLPAGMERFIHDFLRPKMDWRAMLRKYVQERVKHDYSWTVPNRRFVPIGFYLPSLQNEECGEVVIGVDTSGSINPRVLQEFANEVNAIMEEGQPSRTHVMHCDARVGRHDAFERGEPLTFPAIGGGGTDFRPVFQLVEKEGIEPVCLIYLTDLCGSIPSAPPDYPVLWVCTTEKVAPWGETIRLESEG